MKHSLTTSLSFLLIFAVPVICHADIGIIVALDSSVQSFKHIADITSVTKKSGREFFTGNLGGEQITLVRSPMGKVNNAITAQTLISSFPVTTIYSISPAGALSGNLEIGDVVVATKALQHDFGTIKPYGFIWSKLPNSTSSTTQNGESFPLDESLLLPVMTAGKSMRTQHKMDIGILVSGDQFIASRDKAQWLAKKFNASAVDMGGAAIAQTCQANQVPCCLLRVITDRAGVEARGDFNSSVKESRTDIDLAKVLQKVFQDKKVPRERQ